MASFLRRRALLPSVAAGLILTGLSLVVRFKLYRDTMSDTFLAIGPDVSDWVTATSGLFRGDESVLKPNRYVLVPWIAAYIARSTSGEPQYTLLNIAFYAGVFLPWATFIAARRYLSIPAAFGVACWVVFKPGYLALSLSPIGYPVFALAFVVTAGACLGGYGRAGPWVGVLAAVVTAATLNQGILCLLALLPAALLCQRYKVFVAALLGGTGGLWLAGALQSDRYSPFGWMLWETRRYLSGNIPEEMSRTRTGYLETWFRWAEQTLQIPAALIVVVLVLALVGVVVSFLCPSLMSWRRRSAGSVSRRLRSAGRVSVSPSASAGAVPSQGSVTAPSRGAVAALAWASAPMLLLLPLMASAHHLVHLEPLVAIEAGMGLALLRWTSLRWVVALVLVGSIAHAFSREDKPYRFDFVVAQARQEKQLGQEITRVIGEKAVLLVLESRGPSPLSELWRIAWTLPPGVAYYTLPESPLKPRIPIEKALERNTPIFLIATGERTRWTCGPFAFYGEADPAIVSVTLAGPSPAQRGDQQIKIYRTRVDVSPPRPAGAP